MFAIFPVKIVVKKDDIGKIFKPYFFQECKNIKFNQFFIEFQGVKNLESVEFFFYFILLKGNDDSRRSKIRWEGMAKRGSPPQKQGVSVRNDKSEDVGGREQNQLPY